MLRTTQIRAGLLIVFMIFSQVSSRVKFLENEKRSDIATLNKNSGKIPFSSTAEEISLLSDSLDFLNEDDGKEKLSEEENLENKKTEINIQEAQNYNYNYNDPAPYDMYVFSIQWGRTLCENDPSCISKLAKIPKNIFTIHGLWPSYSNGEMMDTCNQGKQIDIGDDGSAIFTKMGTYWISMTNPNDSFWNHEYNTHGYCYTTRSKTTAPKAFFQYAFDLYNKYKLDQLMVHAVGNLSGEHQFTHDDLKAKFTKIAAALKFDLNCSYTNQKQYLQEVRLYFDTNLNPQQYPKVKEDNCDVSKPIYIGFST